MSKTTWWWPKIQTLFGYRRKFALAIFVVITDIFKNSWKMLDGEEMSTYLFLERKHCLDQAWDCFCCLNIHVNHIEVWKNLENKNVFYLIISSRNLPWIKSYEFLFSNPQLHENVDFRQIFSINAKNSVWNNCIDISRALLWNAVYRPEIFQVATWTRLENGNFDRRAGSCEEKLIFCQLFQRTQKYCMARFN